MSVSMLETMAAAMYADNLRQINENNVKRAARQGYIPTEMTQGPFAEQDEAVRKMYLSYARAVLEPMKDLSLGVHIAGEHEAGIGETDARYGNMSCAELAAEVWGAMLNAIKEGK